MRFIITLLLALSVTSCAFLDRVKPEPPIVTKQEYIVKIPPAELLKIPPKVADLDVDNAKAE
jgi:hypothetical protein